MYSSESINHAYLSLGLKVVEVAHDNCSSVKNYVVQDLNLINSYDTWHGKNTCQIDNDLKLFD